jgi:hypothetical protein
MPIPAAQDPSALALPLGIDNAVPTVATIDATGSDNPLILPSDAAVAAAADAATDDVQTDDAPAAALADDGASTGGAALLTRRSETPQGSATLVAAPASGLPQLEAFFTAATAALVTDAAWIAPPVIVTGAITDAWGGGEAAGTPPESGLAPQLTTGDGGAGAIEASFVVNTVDPVSDIADQVVQGDTARSTYGFDGTGIKIGIISDSFDRKGGAATDETDGALPPPDMVHILKEGSSGGDIDEGRAMAEIAHSIAPGAEIYFYTFGSTEADMAQAITALQAAGCQIIMDDVAFLDEPFYEAGGTIAGAVDQVVADGSTYFTAANNFANSYYEGAFNPIDVGGYPAQAFNVAGAPEPWFEPVTIPANARVIIELQWDQPFLTAGGVANGPGSANSLGFNLFDPNGNVVALGVQNDIGRDPWQYVTYHNTTNQSQFYAAVFQNVPGGPTPGQFKIMIARNSTAPIVFGDPNAGIGSGTVMGHEADPNAITVGAAPESNPTKMEKFSGTGTGEYFYDANGNRLPTPVTNGKINVVAPDGNTTSVSALHTFTGTSAAAPAAAAVGALVLQANALLDPGDIANILEDSATPIAGAAALTGAGMVDALLAVGDALTLTFTATATTATILGTHLADTFIGGAGNHSIDGEGGSDTLDYSAAPAAVTIDFSTGLAVNGYGGTDSFDNIEIAKGSALDDLFIAGTQGASLYGGGGWDSLDFSALGAGGYLALDGGSFMGAGANAGTIAVGNGSALQIAGALWNAGSLVADSGMLAIAGDITGAGSAFLANGGLFEIGGADAQDVTFGDTAATLKLDLPSSFTGAIGGLSLGDIIDLAHTAVTSTKIDGSILTVTESGGSTLTYSIGGALAGDIFAIADDGAQGTNLVLTGAANLAEATIAPPSPIALGNVRLGTALSAALSITNSANAPAEGLDVSIAATTGDATASGSISLLGAGATSAGDITLALASATAGAKSGSVTLDLWSDGAGTDGAGTTALPSKTVDLTGAVYREAAPSLGALPDAIVHVGDVLAETLAITNTAAADSYSENLIATVAGTTGGIAAQGTTGDIAAQGAGSITIGISTASAGTIAGSVTLGLQSDGMGIDGFAPTDIGTQIVAVNATVNNHAMAALEEVSGGGTWLKKSDTSYTLSLGTFALGADPVTVALGVLNAAPVQADLLAGSFTISGSNKFTLTGFDAFSGLGAGAADTAPMVTLGTAAGGTFTETIILNPTGSNASGYEEALAPVKLTITGTVAASMSWVGPSSGDRSGDWNTAADWTPKLVPAGAAKAVISAAGSYTVTSGVNNSVGALTLSAAGATLAVTGGTLAVLGTAASTVTGTLAIKDGARLQLTGTTTANGTIALQAAGGAANLAIAGTVSLKGTGQVTLSDAAGNAITSNGAAATLNNYTKIAGSGTIGDATLKLVNEAGAVIDASGATSALTLSAGLNVTNAGLIEATGSAGLVISNTTVTQSTGGLIAAAGGNVYLDGATLANDTLQTSAGAVIAATANQSVLSGGTNTGTVTIGNGTTLALKGTVTNTGTLALQAAGGTASLVLGATAKLQGGGELTMSDDAGNSIVGDGNARTLTNLDTIAGAGTIGDSKFTLSNGAGGVIDATGSVNALAINTGSHTVSNAGLIEATGSAGLSIAGAVTNSGTLAASGGTLSVAGQVTGTGQATIADGTLHFDAKVAATQAITFAEGATGTLDLGMAQAFLGTVAGLAAGDAIDLANFQIANNPFISSIAAIIQGGSTVGAKVTVKDGSLTAAISLMNQFGVSYSTDPAAYVLASDTKGLHPGTLFELAAPGV